MAVKYLQLSFLTILLILANIGCEKHLIGDKTMTLSYKQTMCADAWITNSNDSITVNNIYRYIDSTGIYGPLLSVIIRLDSVPESCSACTCKTGKTIYISVLESETLETKYKNLGFIRTQ